MHDLDFTWQKRIEVHTMAFLRISRGKGTSLGLQTSSETIMTTLLIVEPFLNLEGSIPNDVHDEFVYIPTWIRMTRTYLLKYNNSKINVIV